MVSETAADLVDGGLEERTRNGLTVPIALAVIWNPRAIGANVARELGDGLPELAMLDVLFDLRGQIER